MTGETDKTTYTAEDRTLPVAGSGGKPGVRRRIAACLRGVRDRIRPRTFRAKLTLAIGLVFLIALGSATIVQMFVINGMFSYAMTITYENGQDGKGNGSNGSSSDNDDYLSAQGWSTDPDPDTWIRSHRSTGGDAPDFLGSSSDGKGEGSASGRINGEPYRVDWGGDGSFTIRTPYGVSVWNQNTIANGLRISAAIIFVAFGAISILVIWIVTSRMAKRLQSISDQAAALDPSDLGTRIDVGRGDTARRRRRRNRRQAMGRDVHDDEVTRLGDSINGMLDRIQAASEAERRFVSNASHELRTPIAAVETNLDAPLAQGRFPADVEPSVRRALAANRRGAELVGALLTLSRIQSGAYGKLAHDDTADAGDATDGSTDIVACVKDALADMDEEIAARGIAVAIDTGGHDDVAAKTDPTLMRLAVGNLIRNAVMHNMDSGGSVDVTFTREDDRLRLTIGNTTAERLPDDLTELVQPFHRGANSRISAVSGVGLGLSIADAACEAMDVTLRLWREEREGADRFLAGIDGIPVA
ncbi:sensor histidine kinase [Bifidobacterium parmae]|uniref:histidine kinase n=1 Tax=Bifidobacterium parmae TaxID=361854 RepID=A0A2N5IWR8_9BIFI|nr:HAMP domain-containing sensor histidine kinase [Bifidobacterium parmae]PLS26404.1 two-component system sensor histidine kinase [Bifidobacterium parmae]